MIAPKATWYFGLEPYNCLWAGLVRYDLLFLPAQVQGGELLACRRAGLVAESWSQAAGAQQASHASA